VYGGDGLARLPADEQGRGKAVFVPFVLAGERVDATITEQKPGFARAQLNRVLQPAEQRVEPGCPYYGECGGCHYQHASYEYQLEIKSDILRENLRRIAKIELASEIRAHASPPWNYRNRTRLRAKAQPEFAIGYNRLASHRVLPVRECPISSPLINRALATVWKLGEAGSVPAAVVELEFFADAEDQSLLVEATLAAPGKQEVEQAAAFAQEFRHELPAVVGVMPFVAAADASVRRVDVPKALAASFGSDALTYNGGGANYRVSAGSFFQANRFLVETMLALATQGRSGGFALDLYAGTGLFSLPLSQTFRQVAAVEAAPLSFHDLQANVPSNVTGYRVPADQFLAQVPQETKFDYVVVDPPRGGLGEKVAMALGGLGAPQLTYVSCDPATLARDLRVLMQLGYRVEQAHMLDLFPQTFHIETVLHLGL
jgi:23S rRNA (uracil1939-C5)-methyltransferase